MRLYELGMLKTMRLLVWTLVYLFYQRSRSRNSASAAHLGLF